MATEEAKAAWAKAGKTVRLTRAQRRAAYEKQVARKKVGKKPTVATVAAAK